MKKFLLSCFLALGVGASAQYTANVNFETGDFSSTNTQGFTWFGYGGVNSTAANSCSTANSWIAQFQNVAANLEAGFAMDFSVYQGGQTNNGNKIDVSVNYKKQANFTGTIALAYFEKASSAPNDYSTVTFIGTPVTLTAAAITTCTPLSATIPAGTLDPTKSYGIGVFVSRPAIYTGTVNLFLDDLIITQENTVVPSCTTFASPTNGGTIGAGSSTISWNGAAGGATGYKLTVGTTAGGSDLFNGTVNGLSQTLNLPPSSTLFAKVVPTNANGDATGCTEISFNTNATVSYCTASATSTSYEKIASVLFAGVTKTSTSTAGYENFTSTVIDAERERSYTLTVKSTADAYSADRLVAWIDFNGDGDFDDAGETIVPVTAGVGTGTSWTVTRNITIPANAKIGQTRMRIRFYDNGFSPNTTPCGTTTYGQVEDYTINIKEFLGVNDISKGNISVYPNPFTDVLKISDVKGVKSVSVNDISGREVKSLAPSAELNLSTLQAGLYIVNLKMEDGSVKSFKAIKK